MAWILRLVKIGAEGDGHCTDVMEINRPDDLGDIADLGLTLAEGKLLLAGSNRKSSRRKPETTPFGGRIADAVAAFAA